MPEALKPNTAEHIDEAELVRRYEEKKRLLESAGFKKEARQLFREAFRQHVEEKGEALPPAPAPVPLPPLPSVPADAPPAKPISDPKTKTELEALISSALEEGVFKTVKKVQTETPYLIDAFHDELADHYYEKLIDSGQLKAD